MIDNSKIVYIVDDNIEVGNALQFLLNSIEIKTKVYSSALNFLKDYSPEWVGCLLLDICMPEMNGLILQEKLLSQGSCLPIVILTGHGDVAMAVRAIQQGAKNFLTKPFNEKALIKIIRECFASETVRAVDVCESGSL